MIRENNHRTLPLGVIQVKGTHIIKIMLRLEGETSSSMLMSTEWMLSSTPIEVEVMGWECAWK